MRGPDFSIDGWSLEDGEEYHREAPATFWIPERSRREGLQPGDHAKLIFRIGLGDDPDGRVAMERMWVLVRERIPGGYLGILDNEPDAIEENEALWPGTELPFEPRHVIDILDGDEQTRSAAMQEPRRRWPRDVAGA